MAQNAKPYPVQSDPKRCFRCTPCFLLVAGRAKPCRKHTFSDHSGSVNCILGHRLLSFLLLMLLACTRRRHSRHAKPYPKVISERRKHLFGSVGGCELHSGPPIALLPTAHASCLHPQAPQSACQTIPKSNFGASKTPFRITWRV